MSEKIGNVPEDMQKDKDKSKIESDEQRERYLTFKSGKNVDKKAVEGDKKVEEFRNAGKF